MSKIATLMKFLLHWSFFKLRYPKILLPQKNYPVLKNEDVKKNSFVRETIVDIYQYLAKSILEYIVAEAIIFKSSVNPFIFSASVKLP